MATDRYLTLSVESEGLYREKASKFIAYAFPIADEEAFSMRYAAIAKEHHTCRHVCYGWVIGEKGERYRANDAGEPAGTAGKPLLRQLQGAYITFAAIVVVRYFGGTLLGKGGLVHAYGDAARDALSKNEVVERIIRVPILIICPYQLVERVKTDVTRCEGIVVSANYAELCHLHVGLPRDHVQAFTQKWILSGVQLEPLQGK
jgi:uncharacterized YigZ family protein